MQETSQLLKSSSEFLSNFYDGFEFRRSVTGELRDLFKRGYDHISHINLEEAIEKIDRVIHSFKRNILPYYGKIKLSDRLDPSLDISLSEKPEESLVKFWRDYLKTTEIDKISSTLETYLSINNLAPRGLWDNWRQESTGKLRDEIKRANRELI